MSGRPNLGAWWELPGAGRHQSLADGEGRPQRKGARHTATGWPPGEKAGKVRNVHLGSCRKVDHKTALQKARKLKAEALGLMRNQSAHFNNFYNAFKGIGSCNQL